MKIVKSSIILLILSSLYMTGLLIFLDLYQIPYLFSNTDYKFIVYAFFVMITADLMNAVKMNYILDLQMSFKFIVNMFMVNQRTVFLRQFLPSDLTGISFRSKLISEYTSDETAFFSIIYDKYTQVVATIILGIISTVFLLFLWDHQFVFLGSLIFLIGISLIIILLNIEKNQNLLRRLIPIKFVDIIINRSVSILNLISIQKQIILAILFSCIIQLIYVFSTKLICIGIGIRIDYLALVIAISMVSIIIMLPISFAGFGLREVALVVILSIIMIPPEAGFVISLYILILSGLKIIFGAILNTIILIDRKHKAKEISKYRKTY